MSYQEGCGGCPRIPYWSNPRILYQGEPTGTAGKPIYQHLEGKQLINVLVAVIRYYGGIKLARIFH